MAAVKGMEQLRRTLGKLQTEIPKRALRAGANAALTPIAKALRAAVDGSGASAELKRAAKKTIGKRFGKKKGGARKGEVQAKAGFAVAKTQDRPKKREGRRGVGISAANIHWGVLGTKKRKTQAGHGTGEMPSALAGLAEQALSKSAAAALAAARKKIAEVIARDAKKKG